MIWLCVCAHVRVCVCVCVCVCVRTCVCTCVRNSGLRVCLALGAWVAVSQLLRHCTVYSGTGRRHPCSGAGPRKNAHTHTYIHLCVCPTPCLGAQLSGVPLSVVFLILCAHTTSSSSSSSSSHGQSAIHCARTTTQATHIVLELRTQSGHTLAWGGGAAAP